MKLFILSYVLILITLTIFSYLFIDPNFIYLKSLYTGFNWSYPRIAAISYAILISMFFMIYLVLLRRSKPQAKSTKLLLTPLILFFAYPAMISYDIFNYIATSKVLFHYHENPYLIMPIEFVNDPMLLFTQASNKIALYGPLWITLSGIPYLLSFGNYIAAILGFKVLLLTFFMGIIYLIWRTTKSYFSVLLFAANPLVMVETFLSGHNDIVMMCLALWAFYLLKSKRLLPAVLLIIMSVLIKYSTIFLLPVFIFALFKTLKKETIEWEKIYYYSFISMMTVFLLSIFREEIYPWYAIWPLTFIVLAPKKRGALSLFIALTLGLMLSYIPYMYSGTYFGWSRIVRVSLIFSPPILLIMFYLVRKYIGKLR